jgi:hypothetical protein
LLLARFGIQLAVPRASYRPSAAVSGDRSVSRHTHSRRRVIQEQRSPSAKELCCMSVPQSTLPYGIYDSISSANYDRATLRTHLDAIAAGGFTYVVPYGIVYLSGDNVMKCLDYAGSLGV